MGGARPVIVRFTELLDAGSVNLPVENAPLAAALQVINDAIAALGGGGSLTIADITDFPTLANIATSGSWSDLQDVPASFPPTTHTHTISEISDFPALANIATSGSWNDLSNVPASFPPATHTHTVSEITDFPSLAQVATSGSFSDLSGTISNGTWQAATIALAYGGTSATTASGARANLKVPASDPTGITGADAISNIVSLPQTEYDAIGTPDPTTLYVITS